MTNEEKLATANRYLDLMLTSLREDLADAEKDHTADDVALMAYALGDDLHPDWIDALLWVLALAQIRLAQTTETQC